MLNWLIESTWHGGRSFDVVEASSPKAALQKLREMKGLKCSLKRAWLYENGIVFDNTPAPDLEPTPKLLSAVKNMRGVAEALSDIHKTQPFKNEEEVTKLLNTTWEELGEDPDCDDLRVLWSLGWDWTEKFLP
jgi:hypothetical protein